MTEQNPKNYDISRRVALVVTLLLLIGIAANRIAVLRAPANTEPYHEMIREVAGEFPFSFGKWLGVESPVPQAAITMLKPNVVISRRYQEMGSGRFASFLLIHCKDSRDILGHYPPMCYVGQGWSQVSASPQDWYVDGEVIYGTHYVFSRKREGLASTLQVDNFMVLPDARTARDMDEVERSSQNSRLKYYGAAQVQIVYNEGLSEGDRAEIFKALVHEARPLMAAIMKPSGEVRP